jgi:polyferredoxin
MFRKIRITAAVISLIVVTFLFLDFTGTFHLYFSWFAKVQFIPALIAFNAAAVIAIIALTLIFGRIYCSVICPLGVFQDSVLHIASKLKKNIFSFAPQKWLLRYGFLAAFVLLFFAGGGFVFSLLEPYSAYGRIASELFAPVYQWGNDLLSMLSDSYLFYPVDIRIKGFLPFFIAIATFGAVFTLAWRGGRTYCNTVCPAGTILGFFARFSFFKPVIDTDSCNSCGLCAK